MNITKSTTLASAAAFFALAAVAVAPTVASAADASVHCFGVKFLQGPVGLQVRQP
ncbi:MAG TPA: hypothetical protein VHM27_01080 [Rhizomicrobium sp.]|nr:hypothetical protein [Rhizomicrobium sp.]